MDCCRSLSEHSWAPADMGPYKRWLWFEVCCKHFLLKEEKNNNHNRRTVKTGEAPVKSLNTIYGVNLFSFFSLSIKTGTNVGGKRFSRISTEMSRRISCQTVEVMKGKIAFYPFVYNESKT